MKRVAIKNDVSKGFPMKNDVLDVLSDDALLERVEELTRKERRITFNVVMHIGEVEHRRIYLNRGFGSMFDYCTRGLGYSESAAYRRIATCRCIRKFPQVEELLQRGALTMTTVAMIAGVIRRGNQDELLKAVAGKSQNNVKKIVAGYKTGKPFRDRIRPVVIERPAIALAMDTPVRGESAPSVCPHAAGSTVESSRAHAAGATSESAGAHTPDAVVEGPTENTAKVGENHLRYEGENDPILPGATRRDPIEACGQPQRETYYEFTIAADEEFMHMYRRVRSLQSIKAAPGQDIAATFKALMREHIARHAPEEKKKRRAERKEAKERRESGREMPDHKTSEHKAPECGALKRETREPRAPERSALERDARERQRPNRETLESGSPTRRIHRRDGPTHGIPTLDRHEEKPPRSRYIPAATKDRVVLRDGYQCTYIGMDGTRCGATQHLQFDHVIPFARGGENTPENLRLFCSAHNRLEARGMFGRAVPAVIQEPAGFYYHGLLLRQRERRKVNVLCSSDERMRPIRG